MSRTQFDVETAAGALEAKGCVALTFESHHENPQTVIDYGVAQMANIGSVISSTFIAVNDKFIVLDHLVQKSLDADKSLREELRNQRHEIATLKLAVDYIMDNLKEIFPTLKMSKLNDGFTVAAAFSEQIQAQSSVGAKGEISHSVAPLSEFLDSEESNPVNLANHSDQYKDTNIASVDLAPRLLPEIDFDLDSKVELSENVDNIYDKSIVTSRQVNLNLDLASVSEKEAKGVQQLSMELPSISDTDVEQSISQPKLMSGSWESPMPDVLFKQDTRSPVDLNEAIHIRSSFAIEDSQYNLHGNDSAHSSATSTSSSTVTGAAHVARVSAVGSNRGTGGDTALRREKEREKEREGERERFAMEIEVLKSQIAKLQSDAVLSNSDMEVQVRDLSEQLLDTQEEIKSGLHSSPAFKRLHLSLAENAAEIREMKAREIALAHAKQAENDSIRTGAFPVELEISHAKIMLLNLREDLDFGLDSYADNHAEDPEGNEAFGSPFVVRIGEMADGLDRIISQCQIKESAEATLCSLFRPMDALSIELDALLEMDRIAAESSGVTLDDVTAAGKSRRVRDTMRKVLEACLSLLDRKVNKITMRRRLTALERIVSSKADLSSFLSMEAELRAMMASKVDHADLLSITSKKVSLGEHERLKDQLMKQMVSIRGFDSTAAQQRCPGDASDAADPNSAIELLARRFEILYTFHEDLAAQCRSYVPREEVEQALRALLAEMKVMKNNSVTPDTFADSLSTKASATEVQR